MRQQKKKDNQRIQFLIAGVATLVIFLIIGTMAIVTSVADVISALSISAILPFGFGGPKFFQVPDGGGGGTSGNIRVKKEYLMIDPKLLVRGPEHKETFIEIEDVSEEERSMLQGKQEGIRESYQMFDRIKPVYFEEREINLIHVMAVLDGWKYTVFAQQTGIQKIYACKLTFQSEDDRDSIMVQLQRSYHESMMALYKMIERLWPKYFKGGGYRSDLDDELSNENFISESGRKLNIYEKIGQELNLSSTKVKCIRKIGKVNPLHFERIDTDNNTLSELYSACLKEERGELPSAPSVKDAVYFTNSTGDPISGSSTSTADNLVSQPDGNSAIKDTVSIEGHGASSPHSVIDPQVSVDGEFVIVRGTCECGHQIEIKFNKNQIHE